MEQRLFNIFAIVMVVISFGVLFYLNWDESQKLKSIISSSEKVIAEKGPLPEFNPHKEHIDKIETESGMGLSGISKIISKYEGDKPRPYLDSKGIVTIGIGRSLQTNGISHAEIKSIVRDVNYEIIINSTNVKNSRIYIDNIDVANKIFETTLSSHDVQLLLTSDLNNSRKEAISVFGNWDKIDIPRREALVNLVFNLGLPNTKLFVNFIDAVNNTDWNLAANELLLSQAATDNITRYHDISNVIRTGDKRYFNLK